jgi:TRAP transporter TAXI family solute receptor
MSEKEITFAGSTYGEPWWTLGEVVAKVLEPRGYKVRVTAESAGHANVRWVSSGKAELGPQTPVILDWAVKGIGPYKGEKHSNLASIATIQWPSWLSVAMRRDTGCVDLLDVKERKYPLRMLAADEEVLEIVLNHYGMSVKEIESWGGKFTPMRERAGYWRGGLGDMMMGHIYLGWTPVANIWQEATILYDMRFLDFDGALIKKLGELRGYTPSIMPHGLYRGVDRDISAVGQDSMYIICLRNQSADLVRNVAEGLDENYELFQNTRSIFFYDRAKVWKNPYIPLHTAAEKYYREKGYMK